MNSTTKSDVLHALEACQDENIILDVAAVLQLHKSKMNLSKELIEKINLAQKSVQNGNFASHIEAKNRLNEWSKK